MSWETFYFFCFCVGFLCSAGLVPGRRSARICIFICRRDCTGMRRTARAAKDRRRLRSISEPWRRFWPGSAALAICSAVIRASGRCWRWAWLSLSGLGGAAVVFWFLFKVLLKHDRDLDPADYEMVGVLGRLSSTVRENGTGEMIFSQNGVRRAASARSEDGRPIAQGRRGGGHSL